MQTMNLATNVNLFLGLQSQLRICHWQTKGLGRHQAFGELYEALDGLIDTFTESAMGKYGRFILDDESKTIELNNLSDIDVKSMIDTLRNSFIQMTDELDPSDTDLLNIRDEMLGELNKFAYLITLE
jgi:DNA-binding ferritin-like protein